jgi:hypothetical protein
MNTGVTSFSSHFLLTNMQKWSRWGRRRKVQDSVFASALVSWNVKLSCCMSKLMTDIFNNYFKLCKLHYVVTSYLNQACTNIDCSETVENRTHVDIF